MSWGRKLASARPAVELVRDRTLVAEGSREVERVRGPEIDAPLDSGGGGGRGRTPVLEPLVGDGREATGVVLPL